MNNEKLILRSLKHILLQTFEGKNPETTSKLLRELEDAFNPKEVVPYAESMFAKKDNGEKDGK